jgi:hypothetical protein
LLWEVTASCGPAEHARDAARAQAAACLNFEILQTLAQDADDERILAVRASANPAAVDG